MTNVRTSDVEAVTRELVDLVAQAGGPHTLIEPRGYPHLSLVIIDAVWSLRSQYSTVVNVLQRFCSVSGLSWEDRFDDSTLSGVSGLLETIGPLSSSERMGLFGNCQFAPGTKNRKADAVHDVASALGSTGVEHCADLADADAAAAAVMSVPGVGFAAWRYMLNLSGMQVAKPDTRVVAWVEAAVGRKVPSNSAGVLLECAAKQAEVDVRTADHLVWRSQSGRPISR